MSVPNRATVSAYSRRSRATACCRPGPEVAVGDARDAELEPGDEVLSLLLGPQDVDGSRVGDAALGHRDEA